MFTIPLYQIVKELFRDRVRVFLTILSVAWGTASITLMLAVGEGLRLSFGRALMSESQGILVVKGGQTSQTFRGQKASLALNISRADAIAIHQAIPAIQASSMEYSSFQTFQHAKQIYHGRLLAVEPSYGVIRNIMPKPGGRFINQFDMQNFRRVVVLGPEVAKELFPQMTNPVGQIITIAQLPFLVIGVMQNKLQLNSYIWPTDNYLSWIPASTYELIFKPLFIEDMVLLPAQPEFMASLKQQIRQVFAWRHQVAPNDETLLQFQDTATTHQKIGQFFIGMRWFLGLIGSLTLIVAGVGIANVMFISVSHGIREIGIRMAVGARSYQVLAYYILESLVATAIGGCVGLALAWGIIKLITMIPMTGQIFQIIGKPKPVFSPVVVAIVLCVLSLVGLFAGLFPARKAAQIDPAEALRYE